MSFSVMNGPIMWVSSPVHSLLTDPDDIVTAPPVQYALYGTAHTLQCNVTDGYTARVTWVGPDDSEVNDVIQEVSLDHEGQYSCEVDLLTSDIQTVKFIQLFVIGMFPTVPLPFPLIFFLSLPSSS